MDETLDGSSDKQLPQQQNDEKLLDELQKLYPGEWVVCDHDCTSTDHCHPVGQCRSESAPLGSTALRTVYNPCIHYKNINSTQETRILRIVEEDSSAPLQLIVDVISEPFGEHMYTAVSHTWGNLDDVQRVTLCHIYRRPDSDKANPGVCFRHSYNIIKRLHEALMDNRVDTQIIQSQVAYWWIDAVCINQNNPDERAKQVSIMGKIYSAALFVAVWLQVEPWIAQWAARSIETMRQRLIAKFGQPPSPVHIETEQIVSIYEEDLFKGGKDIDALTALFTNAWFSRVWVLQEIFMANFNAVVYTGRGGKLLFADALLGYRYYKQRFSLGPDTKLWERGAMLLGRPADRVEQPKAGVMGLVPKHLEESPAPFYRMNILDNFTLALGFAATDPRDKLFGILALAEETFNPDNIPPILFPDYSKSVSQVYLDFSWFCVHTYGDLTFLKTVTNTPGIKIVGDQCPLMESNHVYPPLDFPTWCLWHASKKWWASHDPLHSVSHTIRERAKVDTEILKTGLDPKTLPLKGMFLEEIEHVFPYIMSEFKTAKAYDLSTSPPQHIKKSLHSTWNDVLAFFESKGRISDDASQLELFKRFIQTIQCPNDLAPDPLNDRKTMRQMVGYWILSCPDKLLPKELACSKFRARLLFSARLPMLLQTQFEDTYREIIGDTLETDHNAIVRKLTPLAEGFVYTIHHLSARGLFVSKSGTLGLGPYGTSNGDTLVSLRGANFLSVLRKSDEAINWSTQGRGWMFIGEGCVQSWLGGEYVERLLTERDGHEDCYVLV